ncbi:MAG TPA: hypothetical protein VGH42_12240 [Verrucomicrobiae bacterium]|jgi:hypothetical protein
MPAPVTTNTPVRNFRIYTGFTKSPDNDVCNVALDVSTALDGHPVFTAPPFTPAQLTTLQGTFSADMTDARKRGTDRTLTKNISRQALLDALVQDALYCQGQARHDLNTLLTSGYEVVSTNRTSGPLDTPQINSIDNSVSGQLTVRGTAVLNGRMYQLQYSLDNGATWTNAGNFTGARRMILTPTTPGKMYVIQISALGGSTGQSAWSNSMNIMAT